MKRKHTSRFLLFMGAILYLVVTLVFSTRFRIVRIDDNCMYPIIEVGDIIVVEKCSIDSITTGEIVVYQNSGEIIARRAIDTMRDVRGIKRIYTRGDNEDDYTHTVYEESLVGKANRKLNIVEQLIKYVESKGEK